MPMSFLNVLVICVLLVATTTAQYPVDSNFQCPAAGQTRLESDGLCRVNLVLDYDNVTITSFVRIGANQKILVMPGIIGSTAGAMNWAVNLPTFSTSQSFDMLAVIRLSPFMTKWFVDPLPYSKIIVRLDPNRSPAASGIDLVTELYDNDKAALIMEQPVCTVKGTWSSSLYQCTNDCPAGYVAFNYECRPKSSVVCYTEDKTFVCSLGGEIIAIFSHAQALDASINMNSSTKAFALNDIATSTDKYTKTMIHSAYKGWLTLVLNTQESAASCITSTTFQPGCFTKASPLVAAPANLELCASHGGVLVKNSLDLMSRCMFNTTAACVGTTMTVSTLDSQCRPVIECHMLNTATGAFSCSGDNAAIAVCSKSSSTLGTTSTLISETFVLDSLCDEGCLAFPDSSAIGGLTLSPAGSMAMYFNRGDAPSMTANVMTQTCKTSTVVDPVSGLCKFINGTVVVVDSSTSSSLSTGAIVGIAGGCTAFVVLVVCIVLYVSGCCCRSSGSKQPVNPAEVSSLMKTARRERDGMTSRSI